ncbi:DUF4773 domain-containing protein [Camponotus japonicus]
MRLSTIFELLLILLLVAFAAYGRVIDHDEIHRVARAADNTKYSDMSLSTMSLKQAADSVNRYCTCNENICNCCRDFHIPVVQLKGPGCASLQYLQGDNLAVQLSFGDNILTSTIVNGKNPKPVCVPLPGGFTKFCGRIYSIQRDAKNHFKACLGLELQSSTELEASLRVSCFRFGPEGLKLRPAEPLPIVEAESVEEEDDDDFFGLGSDDDDDDDEEDERPSFNSVPDASGGSDTQESDDDDDDDDILGFSALLDIFTGEDETATKKPKITTVAPLLEFTIPILSRPTTPTSLENHELSTFPTESENNEEHEDDTEEPVKVVDEGSTGLTESNTENNTDENQEQITEASNKITYLVKPNKATINKVKKGVVGEKKPSVTSTSVNAIHDPEKPAKKPIKDEYDEDINEDDILDDDDDDVLDDDDEDEVLDDDDEDKNDEDGDNEDKLDDEKYTEHENEDDDDDDDDDEKAEDLAELDDDDDEEEDAMLSALMETGKSKKNKGNQTNTNEHDNEDYDVELDFLTRKHSGGNRQSKLTRL